MVRRRTAKRGGMTQSTQPAVAQAPEWVTAEMPPGYQTRFFELQRLSAELEAMDRIARVLWETGDLLKDAVAAVFGALKYEVDITPGAAGPIVVKLGESRRLLLLVSDTNGPVQKTNEELAQAFQAVQFAAADDRVVFVPNNHPSGPPAERPAPILPEALDVLSRMGVAVVTTATLFGLWRLSHVDPQKVQKTLEHLHAQDGGPFVVPSR